MKRLISSLVIAFSFAVLSTGTALAEHFWQLDMFQPTIAITGDNFNIEYKALSLEKDDDFTVNLFQNGSQIATQNTTKDYGDSGVFNVTVPEPGTYQYHISAQSSVDETIKTTEDRTLTVNTTPSGTLTTVFVNQASTNNGVGETNVGDSQPTSSTEANLNQNEGQVTNDGRSNTDNNGDILGAEKNNGNDHKGSPKNWAWGAIVVLALIGGGAYYYIRRTGNNPFTHNTSE